MTGRGYSATQLSHWNFYGFWIAPRRLTSFPNQDWLLMMQEDDEVLEFLASLALGWPIPPEPPRWIFYIGAV